MEPQTSIKIQLEKDWKTALEPEFSKPYMKNLKRFLKKEKNQGATIFPPGSQIFAAFNQTPLSKVKVVILGQDPYHGIGQAHGLSFSVPTGIRIPPSLQNIYKELASDLNISPCLHGNLSYWASQGVLLLNAVLTVQAHKAASHQNQGWETFTSKAIEELSNRRDHLVFMLWGKYAQQKGQIINRQKHLVLESAHPSPFSAHRGFLGSQPFSKANNFLISKNIRPIDWQQPLS